MAVLALIRNPDEIAPVISWSAEIALARNLPLVVLCWHHAPVAISHEDFSSRELTAAAKRFLREQDQEQEKDRESPYIHLADSNNLEILETGHPDASECTIGLARSREAELIVAAAEDQAGKLDATYADNPLLRNAPVIRSSCSADRSAAAGRRKFLLPPPTAPTTAPPFSWQTSWRNPGVGESPWRAPKRIMKRSILKSAGANWCN
ncbi:hypothetical protein [Microbulbifer taiwanensis]|uniref:hypothetical protein n=1 Tax=Microbulbifer taiwanensis TaxID=986746 RepID=UPI00360677E2